MKTERTMVTLRSRGLLLTALLLVLAVGTGVRSCQFDVQCGDVLSLNHAHYKLNSDLECPDNPSGAAVTITGDDVHFNLAEYTITGDDASGRFLEQGIAVRGANAHIRNGSIIDFNCPTFGSGDCSAIRLFGAPGAKINGMSLHNNTVGILATVDGNADGARIHGNDITGNLRWGIGLSGSAEGAMITGNDLSDTGGFQNSGNGYRGTSDGVSVIGNVASNCARTGIALRGTGPGSSAQRNTIRDNTTLDNARQGIAAVGNTEAFRPRNNLIQSNTSFGNGTWDLREGLVGAVFPGDCLNTWMDNDFDVAEPDCIE